MNILTNLSKLRNNNQKELPSLKISNQRIETKSLQEIAIMRKSSQIVATVLKEIEMIVEPAMTTEDLDRYAERRIREMGATPSFKGYHGFPASICASINQEVVHGIPSPINGRFVLEMYLK